MVSTSRMAMAQNPSEFETYTDTSNGFTLQYPSDWTKNDIDTNYTIVLNSADNSGKVFATILRLGPADLIEVMRNMTLDELYIFWKLFVDTRLKVPYIHTDIRRLFLLME